MADDIDIYGLIAGLQGKSRDEEEMVGTFQEILGSGGSREEILGAAVQALASSKVKASPSFAQALAARLAKRSPVTQTVAPTKKRRWVVGFGPAAVPPGMTITAQTQPQVLFRGEKLINTGDSTNLYILGMFVGNLPQLPNFQNAIAVGTFAPTVLDNEMLFDTCQPAINITFQVQNTGSATQTWSMSLLGHIVQ